MKPVAILRLLSALFMLGLASLACSLTPGPPAIGEVVMAKNLDSDYKPVDPTTVYGSDDTLYVSVEVNDLIIGSVVDVKYKFGSELYKDSTLTADEEGSGYYGFKLSTEGGHTPGDYTAEVYLDGKLIKTVEFKVEASGPPSIGEVVAAKGLDADYKPVDPTSTFSPNDVFYISIRVKNLVVGSVVTVKYKLEGEDYSDTTLAADKFGSGYYGFKLSADGGHATGNYTAEVYLDDKLVKTVEFTVK